jgi:hypothetical protein
MSSLHGMKIAAFVQPWSVMVSIESYPCETGNLTMKSSATVSKCYGRLAVVSDVDDGGVCPECRQRVGEICRAISKQVQRSDARIEVDVMHTGNECTE